MSSRLGHIERRVHEEKIEGLDFYEIARTGAQTPEEASGNIGEMLARSNPKAIERMQKQADDAKEVLQTQQSEVSTLLSASQSDKKAAEGLLNRFKQNQFSQAHQRLLEKRPDERGFNPARQYQWKSHPALDEGEVEAYTVAPFRAVVQVERAGVVRRDIVEVEPQSGFSIEDETWEAAPDFLTLFLADEQLEYTLPDDDEADEVDQEFEPEEDEEVVEGEAGAVEESSASMTAIEEG